MKPAAGGRVCSLRRKTRGLVIPVARLAAPGAPVSSRADEVLVGRDRLLVRRLAVSEQATLAPAHLEEAQVLAVPRPRRMARLAPGDLECLTAVTAAEDAADGDFRRCLGQPCSSRRSIARSSAPIVLLTRARRIRALRERGVCDLSMFRRAEQRAVVLEEPDDRAVLSRCSELPLETHLQGDCRLLRSRRSRRLGRRLRDLPFRYRRDLCRQNEHAQANE